MLIAPGCPNADSARCTITECLQQLGLTADIEERVGAFPSPTVLIDGRDAMGTGPVSRTAVCRLDVPTATRILAALRAAASGG